MASKTSVAGQRVTIDDSVYEVRVLGAGKHKVVDDFGDELGLFTLTGKTVEAEDYGVEGMHEVARIAKLWVAAAMPAQEQKTVAAPSKMVCKLVTHAHLDAPGAMHARKYQAWLKKQSGVKAAFFAGDEAGGKGLSVSVWESQERLSAFEARVAADAPPVPASLNVDVVKLADDL